MKKQKSGSFADSFKTRAFRAGGYSIAATAILLVMLIVINLLVGALPSNLTKFDITDNQLYSISEQTKSVVGSVKQDVTIYWILTEGNENSYVSSLLELVQEQSSHIKVVKKDTDVYPNFATAYTAEAVYPNSLVVECGEKYRYLNYSGDIYTYEYADPSFTTYNTYFNGEGALVSAIEYVTSAETPKMCVLTGHGEAALSTFFATGVKNENIETAELDLLVDNAVPADADLVLICNPAKDITEPELEKLRVYTANGGNLLVITNYIKGEMPNLETLMAEYGMSKVSGTVVDNTWGYYMGTQTQIRPDMVSHAITDPLIKSDYPVLFNGAHGIKVSEKLAAELTVTELLVTSDGAYAKADLNAGFDKAADDVSGPFALAALSTKQVENNRESNVLWVGSASLVDENNVLAAYNLDLLLNMLGYLADPETAEMTIHAKPLTDTKLLVIDSTTSLVLKLVMLALIPLGYVVCGVIIWYRRKKQ